MLLEVSIGEAIDKLSILDIKLEKINDQIKKNFIWQEFEYLSKVLEVYIKKYNFYYKCMKNINLEIWDLQDELRSMNFDNENYSQICEKVILLNDSRFQIKNKINNLENSKFQEQKGYNKKVAQIVSEINNQNIIIIISIIRFLSLIYDEVCIFTKSDISNFIENYSELKSINIEENILENVDIFSQNNEYKTKITHPFLKYHKYIYRDNINTNIDYIFKQMNLDPKINDIY
jgi:hypothetical protein